MTKTTLNPGTHHIPATPSPTTALAPAAVTDGAAVPLAPTLPEPTTLAVAPGSAAPVTPVPDDAAPAIDPAPPPPLPPALDPAVPVTATGLVPVLVGVCATPADVVGGGTTVTTTVDVGSTNPPVSVGTAYGGSNKPNRPHALHGYAHSRTCVGAASTGSHRESTMVAMAVGSAVWGQSVPRSARVSCRVMSPPVAPGRAGAMVETWWRSRGRSQEVVEGPVSWPAVLMPTAVGMSM